MNEVPEQEQFRQKVQQQINCPITYDTMEEPVIDKEGFSYGPNDNFSLKEGHVIPSLIHQCFLTKKENKNFIVKGTGNPLRQFIYSTNVAKLILWTLKNYKEKESIILSVSKKNEISIKNVVIEIAKNFNYENFIKFDSSHSDGQYKKTADNSKLQSYLPFF